MALNQLGLGFTFTARDLASNVMGQLGGNLAKTEDAAGGVEKSMKKMGTGIRDVGIATAAAGAAISVFLGLAIQKSAEFEKAIALVATEANLAIFPQTQMVDVAQKLAQTYGKLPIDEANALYKAVALGANTAASATSLLTGANLLAVAGNSDLNLTMNALGGALNAYGGDMSKATDFSDALFVAMKNGNTTIQDLAASIGHITSAAAGLNIPIEEVLGAVSVMTNKGVQAAEAVTGLKAALQSVMHPTADAAAEAAKLGIKFNQAEIRSKGLVGFLAEIKNSSKFTAESFSKLFAGEGANAIAQVAGDMNALNNVMAEMGKKAGATQAGFDLLSATLEFQEDKFKSLKDSALIAIGDAIKPAAAAVLKVVNALITGFMMIPAPVRTVMTRALALAAALLTVAGTVGTLVGFLATSEVPILGIAAGLGIVLQVMGPLVVVGGLVIGMLYGLKAAVDGNIGGIKDTLVGAYTKIKLVIDALGQLFSDGGFSGAIREDLNKAGNQGIKQFAVTVFMWFSRIEEFVNRVGAGFNKTLEANSGTFQKLSDAVKRLGTAFSNLFGGANDPAKNAASFDTFGAAGEKVGAVLETIIDYATKGITFVTDFATAAVSAFTPYASAIGDIWTQSAGLIQLFGQIMSAVNGLGSSMGGGSERMSGMGRGMSLLGVIIEQISNSLRTLELVLRPVLAGLEKIQQIKNTLSGSGGLSTVVQTHSVDNNSKASGADLAAAQAKAVNLAIAGGRTEGSTPVPLGVSSPIPVGGAGPATAGVAAAGSQAPASREGNGNIAAGLERAMAARKPDNVSFTVPIILDGEKIAEHIVSGQGGNANRSFQQTPAPAG